MQPIQIVTSKVAPMDRADVDTDQIIPKQFLKRIERTGFGEFLFHDWRTEDFYLLDKPEYAGAQILVAGRNFGCGSSREHAPWALVAWGIRAVITTSCAETASHVGLRPTASIQPLFLISVKEINCCSWNSCNAWPMNLSAIKNRNADVIRNSGRNGILRAMMLMKTKITASASAAPIKPATSCKL